jgi:hypothetical protein
MSFKYPEVHTITVRLITDKPVRKTPYQVKGVLMRKFHDKKIVPMLNGTYRDKFLYPRIQVKILNEQIYFVATAEGVEPIKDILSSLDSLDFGNITFEVSDKEIEEEKDYLKPLSKLLSYRFVTPWIALNQATGKHYRNLKNEERTDYLNNLIGQNIVFISREMGIELENNIFTKVKLASLFPKNIDENNWGGFEGEFETNFILPNYIGLGNGITRGYGTILGLFEPDSFSKKEEKKDKIIELDVELLDDSEVYEIDVQKVPRPKKTNAKSKFRKKKLKRSKKILSEEFDIELDEKPKRKKSLRQGRKSKNTKSNTKSNKHKKSAENEINFNSEEYHKKQHSF